MGLPTNRASRGASGKTSDKGTTSKGGAAPAKGAGNMPGTGDDDDDEEVIVSKSPPPANGEFRARVGRCYRMRKKAARPGEKGELVKDKDGNVLDPKLEMIIDDPREQKKLLANEPSWHQRSVGQLMNLSGNWRDRTNKLCAGLGFPEADWPEREHKPEGAKKSIKVSLFPMKDIDALSAKVDGKYKYFKITVSTTAGEGANKGTPYTNITAIAPWVEPAEKKSKKKKDEPEPEPEPEDETEEESEEEESEETEGEDSDESEDDEAPGDEDIPPA
jgi:hypothetical protein